jgi:hypothetical protein
MSKNNDLNIKELIEQINQRCKVYFLESSFLLEPIYHNMIIAKSNYYSEAVNNYKNERKRVDVIKWFKDFWVYVEIRIDQASNRNNSPDIIISISVFQGDESDRIKNQLFRAEWDNYTNSDAKHPQPHWHIYPVMYHHETFTESLELLDDGESFQDILNGGTHKIVDLKKIHFAMNGQWSSDGKYVHTINDTKTIVKWFSGVFECIKTQLEYVS